ncbi:cytochrome P450 2F2-like [Pelodytes ibericus]
MDVVSLPVVLLLILITFMLLKHMKMMRQRARLPPGPTPLPFIGTMWKMDFGNVVKSLQEMNRRYGDLFTIYQGNQPYVVICGYQAMKETLIEKAEEFSNRAYFPAFYDYTQGNGIAFSSGEKWKELRRFGLSALRNFGMGKRSIEERIQEEAQYLIAEIKTLKGSPFDPKYYLAQTVSNVICSVIFGDRFEYTDGNFQKLVKNLLDTFRIISSPWGALYNVYPSIMSHLPGPHQKITPNFNTITDYIRERMEENKQTLDHNCPRDFIDCFLIKMGMERNQSFTYFNETSLVMTTLILFISGTETVTLTLRHGLLLLMKHPEVAEKIYEEIDNIIGHHRPPNFEDRIQMPYVWAFIHEVQRFSDVIPLAPGHELTKDTQVRGYMFPKGTYFLPFLTTVLFDKTQFKNPEKFDVGHFLDENGKFRKNEALLAFSAGKRMCIGENLAMMELFLYFTTILQNFTIKSLVPAEEISTCPTEVALGNIPPSYQFCLIAR